MSDKAHMTGTVDAVYLAWRISYQSSEQAARAAYRAAQERAIENYRLQQENERLRRGDA